VGMTKQRKKLLKLMEKAAKSISNEESKEIIKKLKRAGRKYGQCSEI